MKTAHRLSYVAIAAMLAWPAMAEAAGNGAGGSSGSGSGGSSANSSGTTSANSGTSNAGSTMGTASGTSGSTGSTTGAGNGMVTGSTSSNGINSTTAGTSNTAANWNEENSYWRSHYPSQPYYHSSREYSVYEPAYRYGVDLYNKNPNMTYDQLNQEQLSKGWSQARGTSSNLSWTDAQAATRSAYNRLHDSRNTSNVTSGTMSPAR